MTEKYFAPIVIRTINTPLVQIEWGEAMSYRCNLPLNEPKLWVIDSALEFTTAWIETMGHWFSIGIYKWMNQNYGSLIQRLNLPPTVK